MRIRNAPKAALLALALSACLFARPADAAALHYAGPSPVLTFDPHASTDFTTLGTVLNVYDTLVGRDQNLDLRPALATSWESVSPTVWRLKLRDGVTFTGGQPFTADDAKFSIERANAGGKGMLSQFLVSVDSVNVVDDHTIEIVTKYPDPLIPRWLTSVGMMSRAWAEEHDSVAATDLKSGVEEYATRHANGTGPYSLASWDATSGEIKLERNPNWWGKAEGNVTEATFSPISAAPTRVAALLSGNVDMIVGVPLQDVERIKGTAGFQVLQRPELRQMVVLMSPENPTAADTFDRDGKPLDKNPWADVRVRKAVSLAIDVKGIAEKIMRGHAKDTSIASMPGMEGYPADLDTPHEYDPEQSKALLAEAGYPNGFKTRLRCTNDRYANDEAVCRALASMLARVGIDTEPSPEPWATFVKDLVALKIDFLLLAAAPNGQTTFDMLQGTWMSRNPPNGAFNWSRWSSPEFDKAVDAMKAEFDPKKREDLTRKALEILRDQVGGVFLYQQYVTWGARDAIKTVVRPDNYVVLNAIEVAQ